LGIDLFDLVIVLTNDRMNGPYAEGGLGRIQAFKRGLGGEEKMGCFLPRPSYT
jgi:hypothetical protein